MRKSLICLTECKVGPFVLYPGEEIDPSRLGIRKIHLGRMIKVGHAGYGVVRVGAKDVAQRVIDTREALNSSTVAAKAATAREAATRALTEKRKVEAAKMAAAKKKEAAKKKAMEAEKIAEAARLEAERAARAADLADDQARVAEEAELEAAVAQDAVIEAQKEHQDKLTEVETKYVEEREKDAADQEREAEAIGPKLERKGKKWNVINASGEVVNEKPLNKSDAKALLGAL